MDLITFGLVLHIFPKLLIFSHRSWRISLDIPEGGNKGKRGGSVGKMWMLLVKKVRTHHVVLRMHSVVVGKS